VVGVRCSAGIARDAARLELYIKVYGIEIGTKEGTGHSSGFFHAQDVFRGKVLPVRKPLPNGSLRDATNPRQRGL
jgi:hypothetical protein